MNRTRLLSGLAAVALLAASPAVPVLSHIVVSEAAAAALPESFAPLINQVKPAVVSISTTQVQAGTDEQALPEMPNLPPGSPFAELFKNFRQGQGKAHPQTLHALGSGFIIDASGYVVTNNHVIDKATDISVIMQSGESLKAKLVGHDERTDLALLKVESSTPLPAVQFGDSNAAQVGDWILAVGNPFGLGGTVTAGIISAKGRDIHSGPYDDYLQLDASINRGNSGGPTFDTSGHVIGVNTAIYSPNGGSVGIGFAIPANTVRNVVDQLKTKGSVDRGFLGVQIQQVTPELAGALNLSGAKGALVAGLTENSPAAKAGLRQGDVIVDFAGKPVEGPRDLTRAVAATPSGTNQTVKVVRQGETLTLGVTLAAATDTAATEKATSKGEATPSKGRLGLNLAPLNEKTRDQFEIAAGTQGVVIAGVAEDSPAAEHGLEAGDVIQQIDGKAVTSPSDVARSVEGAVKAKRKAVAMLVNRKGASQFIAIPLQNG